jgi:fructosamine-3-kinase
MAARIGHVVGSAAVVAVPVTGGSICDSYRAQLADGRVVFAKTLDDPPVAPFDGARLLPTEADGLSWLAAADGVPTPAVLGVDDDLLVLEWLDQTDPTAAVAERFGRELAVTHRAGAPGFGHDRSGFLGPLAVPNGRCPTWPEFYARRRLQPLLRLARDARSLGPDAVAAVEKVIGGIEALAGPAEPPHRLHGDLWSGNVLWCTDGRCRLVDPSAYGGHRETDLAMLTLFGLPHLPRVLAAYDEAYPLADGWRERVGLHQLVPLLVHAALFGGGYGDRVGETARRLVRELT